MFVVGAREQALVIRFGKIQSVKTEPGLYFKLPFGFLDADRVQYVSEQALRFDLDNNSRSGQGGKFYESMPSSSTRSPMPSSFARPFRVT